MRKTKKLPIHLFLLKFSEADATFVENKESGPLKKHWKKREFDTTEKSASENKTGNKNQG